MTDVLLENPKEKSALARKLLSYVRAPAKINLNLNTIARQSNGYHNIASLVIFVDLADGISIEYDPGADNMSVTGPFADAIPHNDTNLAQRALDMVATTNPGLHIRLTKFIPTAAGLGGGSADAAAVLRALVSLRMVNRKTAKQIAYQLGADVNACLYSDSLYAQGIGEHITLVNDLPPMFIMLAKPDIAIPTHLVFGAHEITHQRQLPMRPNQFADIHEVCAYLQNTGNDLQATAIKLHPQIADLLHTMKQQPGALYSAMSGSGSTCFSIYNTMAQARKAEQHLGKQKFWTAVAEKTNADYSSALTLAEGIAFS